MIRPVLLYEGEYWAIKNAQEQKLEVTEMRMLRWICGRPMLNILRIEYFRNRLQVTLSSNKLRERRLRCFDHVRRRQMYVSHSEKSGAVGDIGI